MRSGNRGQVIIVFVLSLLVLLGFAALAIDVGYMYSVRNDLQRSADSGALAGAYVFHDGGWVSGPVPPSLRTKAESRARNFATRDPVGAAPLANAAISFPYDTDPSPSKVNQITVTVQDNVNLFFAGVIGSPTVTLTATATAEAIRVGQNVECLKPLAVPLPFVNVSVNDDRYNLGVDGPVSLDCGPGILCQGTHLLHPRHLRIVDVSSSPISIPQVQQNSGRLFALDMCGSGGVGNSTYRNWIQSGCTATCPGGGDFVAGIGDRIRVRNNQSPTPTRNGLNALIGLDRGASFNFDPVDYPNLPGSGAYRDDRWINSPRVIRVILYDPSVVANPALQIDRSIPVWGFAGFWINRVYSRRISGVRTWFVDGYLIPNSAVEDPIPLNPPPPPSIEPSLKTTRLVQ